MGFTLIPKKWSSHRHYPMVLKVLRVLQLIWAFVSLGLFADYLVKASSISNGNAAATAIIVLSLIYCLITTFLICFFPSTSWYVCTATWVMDFAFGGAYVAVAVLTRPKSGCGVSVWVPGVAGGGDDGDDDSDDEDDDDDDDDDDSRSGAVPGRFVWSKRACRNATAVFALAIMSV